MSGPDQAPAIRAAQYLRMSTEHQVYSMQNQAAAIARYASRRGYQVVRTYSDAGRSGLTLKGRAGLRGLIGDILGGGADFATVLVYDVSRWGRFQDPDQSGHYEFLCREAGVPVRYCAEPFENDGSVSASLLKQLKRIMAAEFSRELGVKVAAGQRRIAALGFSTGGPAPYGLRRQLVAPDGQPRMVLARGQHKAMTTDRVRLAPGPEDEIDTVRAIFRLFVSRQRSLAQITRRLQITGRPPPAGGWSRWKVRNILQNEIYAGVQVFGRMSERLATPRRRLPEAEWLRIPVLAPIVTRRTWSRAQEILAARVFRYTEEQLVTALRQLIEVEGELSYRRVLEHPGAPALATLKSRFGGLRAAAHLAGYELRPCIRWSAQEILDFARDLHGRHGAVTCRLISEASEGPSLRTVFARFRSLQALKVAAGLEEFGQPQIERRGLRWSRAAVARELVRVHAARGKLTHRILIADPGAPRPRTVRRHFGSLAAATDLLGLRPRGPDAG